MEIDGSFVTYFFFYCWIIHNTKHFHTSVHNFSNVYFSINYGLQLLLFTLNKTETSQIIILCLHPCQFTLLFNVYFKIYMIFYEHSRKNIQGNVFDIHTTTTTKALCSLNVSLKEAVGRGYNL